MAIKNTNLLESVNRRDALRAIAQASTGAATVACSGLAFAQQRKPADNDIVLTQIVDISAAHQDVSRDYLVGARAAWQEVNQRGGLRGRQIRHQTVETNGSVEEIRAAVTMARETPACVALFGSAGHLTAQLVSQQLQQEKPAMAHIAPWLQADPAPSDLQTFPIFATRQAQIEHAIKNLASMNVQEVGAVYASSIEFTQYADEVERTARGLKLKVQHFHKGSDLVILGQGLKLDSPAILLFFGGTPELAKFAKGLEQQTRMRYCVAMADVNLQTLAQMGAAKNTPIIVTQVVPMVNAQLPVVRAFRDVLSRLFDEPPTPLSLSGYIAARYTFEVLKAMNDVPNRQNVLAAFQQTSSIDLGGFRVGSQRTHKSYVTQSMLAADGRLVG